MRKALAHRRSWNKEICVGFVKIPTSLLLTATAVFQSWCVYLLQLACCLRGVGSTCTPEIMSSCKKKWDVLERLEPVLQAGGSCTLILWMGPRQSDRQSPALKQGKKQRCKPAQHAEGNEPPACTPASEAARVIRTLLHGPHPSLCSTTCTLLLHGLQWLGISYLIRTLDLHLNLIWDKLSLFFFLKGSEVSSCT